MANPYTPYYYQAAQAYQPQMIPPPYQDRLAQLQTQYQNTLPQMPAQTPPQTNQGLLWVQGEAGAKSYLVAPNTTVLLMDSESQRFYLKSTDGAGMPSLRTFEYSEMISNVPQAPQNIPENLDDKYVTREEYKSLQSQYMDIMDKINNLNSFRDISVAEEPAKKPTTRTVSTRGKGGNADE